MAKAKATYAIRGMPDRARRQPLSTDGCEKKGFNTKADAKLYIRNLRGQQRKGMAAGGQPTKGCAYRCLACGKWHMTRMPRDVSAAIGRSLRGQADG